MSTPGSRIPSSYLEAARERPRPWDPARAERVLSSALGARKARAQRRAARLGVAAACGAALLFGLGLRAVAFTAASDLSGASGASGAESATGGEPAPSGERVEASALTERELAALARGDGGYGRD